MAIKPLSFIEIIQEQAGISFRLNKNLVSKIYQAQQKKSRLKIPEDLLTEIYQYIINSNDQLNFYTYYNQKALIKTAITLQGNLSSYFHQDFLQDSTLTQEIVNAHNWLIAQILAQLKAPSYHSKKVKYNFLPWLLAFVITALIVGLNLSFLTPINPLHILFIILGFLLLSWLFSLILKR